MNNTTNGKAVREALHSIDEAVLLNNAGASTDSEFLLQLPYHVSGILQYRRYGVIGYAIINSTQRRVLRK